MANSILIIDDEEKLRKLMARIITLEGFEVSEVQNIKAARQKLSRVEFDVIICDVKLPDGNGIDLIPYVKATQPFVEIILLTAYGNIPDGVQAIKNGAFDYITKGDDNNRVIPLVHRAMEKVSLAKRVRELERQVGQKYAFDQIIGNAKEFQEAVILGKKVAETDTTVLLLGETGTGKEVFAQAIHQESVRRSKPFVALNCSALSREIMESELFGHKAGAFTGALKDKKGLFEEANRGTLFLDEIGEMALELQAKLLRVLETGEFIKVGDTQATKVNVRIVAATNRNLEEEATTGSFRADLYYRLSVFQITLPSLRERLMDIPLLAKHFLNFFALKSNKKIDGFTPEYMEALKKNSWKGNIRELKNMIERSVILADHSVIDVDCLPYELRHVSTSSSASPHSFALADIEKMHIKKVLTYTNGNKTEAAKLLQIGIATLYRKVDEYQL